MNFYLRMRKISFIIIVLFTIQNIAQAQNTKAPELQLVTTPSNASLRGLDVVNENIVWVTGSKGTYMRTLDAGVTWKIGVIVDSLDFRDVHAFDKNNAVVISSGSPATIFKTTDGGDTWRITYENRDERVWLYAYLYNLKKR